MGMPFPLPVVGAGGVLVIGSIHSPNFVHGVSGWSINQDGTIEARSIVIPPGSGGATIFVQPTAPTANAVGDLWYNSASGFEASQWSGSAWVPFQYGTAAIANGSITAALIAANTITAAQIAAGTITAAKLAAGIVVAGIVDATTITGALFIADGTTATSGHLVYFGVPAAGNLVLSSTPGAGTDSHGNTVYGGHASYDGSGDVAALTNAGLIVGELIDPSPARINSVSGTLQIISNGVTQAVMQFLSEAAAGGTVPLVKVASPAVLQTGAGTDTSPSVPVVTPTFANGTAAQLSDVTRDYMLYLTIGTAGSAFSVAIGPTSTPADTIISSITPTAGQVLTIRLPAGWWLKWSGTSTTLARQRALGC